MKRGPLDAARKQRAASAVHYFFAAVWGGLYGLWWESFRTSPFLFGVGVWMASDNLLLPAFRVAAWPRHYSMAEHRYALAAHAVYGLATAGCYALLRDLGPVPLRTVPPLLALQASAWMLRTPPMRLLARRQPPHRRLLRSALVRKVALA